MSQLNLSKTDSLNDSFEKIEKGSNNSSFLKDLDDCPSLKSQDTQTTTNTTNDTCIQTQQVSLMADNQSLTSHIETLSEENKLLQEKYLRMISSTKELNSLIYLKDQTIDTIDSKIKMQMEEKEKAQRERQYLLKQYEDSEQVLISLENAYQQQKECFKALEKQLEQELNKFGEDRQYFQVQEDEYRHEIYENRRKIDSLEDLNQNLYIQLEKAQKSNQQQHKKEIFSLESTVNALKRQILQINNERFAEQKDNEHKEFKNQTNFEELHQILEHTEEKLKQCLDQIFILEQENKFMIQQKEFEQSECCQLDNVREDAEQFCNSLNNSMTQVKQVNDHQSEIIKNQQEDIQHLNTLYIESQEKNLNLQDRMSDINRMHQKDLRKKDQIIERLNFYLKNEELMSINQQEKITQLEKMLLSNETEYLEKIDELENNLEKSDDQQQYFTYKQRSTSDITQAFLDNIVDELEEQYNQTMKQKQMDDDRQELCEQQGFDIELDMKSLVSPTSGNFKGFFKMVEPRSCQSLN